MLNAINEVWKRRLVAWLIRGIGITTRKTWINWQIVEELERAGTPFICCLWHNNLMYFSYVLRGKGLGAMVSQSRDGEGIAAVLERFGFEPVRGSTSRGGLSALRGFLRMLGQGQSVAITPDGPQGPRYELKGGVVALAARQGVPILPMCFSAPGCWEFGSWDRMKLPKPFSKVAILVGAPLRVGRQEDPEAARLNLQKHLRQLVVQAEAFTGGTLPDREPTLRGLSPHTR